MREKRGDTMIKKAIGFILVAAMLCTSFVSFAAEDEGEYITLEETSFTDAGSLEDVSNQFGISEATYVAFRNALISTVTQFKASMNIYSYGIPYTSDSINALSLLLSSGNALTFNLNVGSTGFTVSGGKLNTLKFTYSMTADEYNTYLGECDRAVDRLVSDFENDENLSDLQKALLVHDRIAVHCEYDADVDTKNIPWTDSCMYGALVLKECVCEGYAEAYSYILDRLGIENYLCSSYQLSHIWNIITVDGARYHVDVTHDDKVYDVSGKVYHDNFLASTEALKAGGSHSADDYDTSPSDTTYDDAFWKNVYASFDYLKGTVYYIDRETQSLCSWDGVNSVPLESVAGLWRYQSWGNQARLQAYGDYLFYSLPDGIYLFDVRNCRREQIFAPDLSAYSNFAVYGFKIEDDKIYCDVYSSYAFSATAKADYEIVTDLVINTMTGDVDGDGGITVKDSKLLMKYLLGLCEDREIVFRNSDTDADSCISTKDTKNLTRLLLEG